MLFPRRLINGLALACCWLASVASAVAASTVRNERYELTLLPQGEVQVRVKGLPPQSLLPRFTVTFSETDPGYHRNHQNYLLAPRTAIRWAKYQEDLPRLNEWLATPDALASSGARGEVVEDGHGGRQWIYRDGNGKVVHRVSGTYASGTINPFAVGRVIQPEMAGATVVGNTVRWSFVSTSPVKLSAEVSLPPGDQDPVIRWHLSVAAQGYYSVAYTGAPSESAEAVAQLPQECMGRGFRQWNFVVCEGDLKLPRAHLATPTHHALLVVDAKEGPFRLVNKDNSRYGLMLERREGRVRPVALAPLMGGPESQMRPGGRHSFALRYVLRDGDWKDAYRYVARRHYGFRDQRDNSGAGSINAALENVVDYLVDRNGKNHAMWHDEQKYYDYWSDKSGVYKPFSPLHGLSAAVITDDERFYRARALPAVEFALSRKSNVFSPYELFDNKMISNPTRALGGPYPPLPQLVSLDNFFQNRTFALAQLAREAEPNPASFADLLALHRLSGDRQHLQAAGELGDKALKRPPLGGPTYSDWIELYEATGQKRYLEHALERAYHAVWEFNLSPAVPETKVVMDKGGKVPIHVHSFGRHKAWGFPPPEEFPYKQQVVPAWRPAVNGLISDAYRGGLWMHHHGQFMRVAALTGDDLLRDVARWGWVGRFGNYNGDNRSELSLITESPDAIENPIWKLTYSTINPGHAWEFVGEMLDFLLSDAFHRSAGKIDFPSESMHGSDFRVKTYGARPGRFYDEQNVHLWLPRKLLDVDNRQFDYLAGYGNGKLYLAIWSQSFQEETATVTVNEALADLSDGPRQVRVWRQNAAPSLETLSGNVLRVTVAPKGIIALAIENVTVRPQLRAKMLDPGAVKLGQDSLVRADTPFGKVHGMLLSMGRGLTNAFIYAEALPENVISARLRHRQGAGEWREQTDDIFPFEFSFDYDEAGPPLEFVFEIEDADQQIQRSATLTLRP